MFARRNDRDDRDDKKPMSDAEWAAADALEAVWESDVQPDADLQPLLFTARQLTDLAAALPPPSLALTQRVRRLTAAPPRPAGRLQRIWSPRPWLRVATALVLAVLALSLFTAPGQRAMAALMASLNLGDGAAHNVRVNVSPDPLRTGPQYTGARAENLANLDTARARVPYPLLEPAWLPPGYTLQGVSAVSYAGMPDWFPQPLYIETDYRAAGASRVSFDLTLRQFGVALGETGRIRTLRFDSVDVTATQEVQVNGRAALLLTLGQPSQDAAVRELVWQQGDVMIEILSQSLSPEDMLAVAASLR